MYIQLHILSSVHHTLLPWVQERVHTDTEHRFFLPLTNFVILCLLLPPPLPSRRILTFRVTQGCASSLRSFHFFRLRVKRLLHWICDQVPRAARPCNCKSHFTVTPQTLGPGVCVYVYRNSCFKIFLSSSPPAHTSFLPFSIKSQVDNLSCSYIFFLFYYLHCIHLLELENSFWCEVSFLILLKRDILQATYSFFFHFFHLYWPVWQVERHLFSYEGAGRKNTLLMMMKSKTKKMKRKRGGKSEPPNFRLQPKVFLSFVWQIFYKRYLSLFVMWF